MRSYIECWEEAAAGLLPQALAGEPQLAQTAPVSIPDEAFGFAATLAGDWHGTFSVFVDARVLETPLLGEGIDQRMAWGEVLREIAGAAAGRLHAAEEVGCRVESFAPCEAGGSATHGFELKSEERSWTLLAIDALVSPARIEEQPALPPPETSPSLSPGLELLLDVELETSLRFGSREMALGEILDLGPGDVVQLDRQVSDPVDLLVADKIVARGEVVLVNGNFGLRVTEVAAPRKRLESIRCLF